MNELSPVTVLGDFVPLKFKSEVLSALLRECQIIKQIGKLTYSSH